MNSFIHWASSKIRNRLSLQDQLAGLEHTSTFSPDFVQVNPVIDPCSGRIGAIPGKARSYFRKGQLTEYVYPVTFRRIDLYTDTGSQRGLYWYIGTIRKWIGEAPVGSSFVEK